MKNSEFLTLILADCKEARLGVLTQKTPKPTVTFAGVHCLIDFALSNCRHSKVGDVAIVTSHHERILADYVGCGSRWRPESGNTDITILPSESKSGISELYSGSADAILMNLDFIEEYDPKNVLVLSGDHVYKMNYARLMAAHAESGAAATVAAVNVPLSEASRYGVMLTDKSNTIIDYAEKPISPKSYLVSMDVYVFNWQILKKYLMSAKPTGRTGLDLGREIIQNMLIGGEKLIAHRFHGYWKDFNNAYSLWEANMELLSASPSFDVQDCDWKIIGRKEEKLVRHDLSYVGDAYIADSLVTESAVIKGTVTKSVISADVEIGKDARIVDSVIMPGAKIGRGSVVLKAIVGPGVVVEDYSALGGVKPDGKCLDNFRGVSVVGSSANVYTNKEGRLAAANAV